MGIFNVCDKAYIIENSIFVKEVIVKKNCWWILYSKD